MVGGGGGEVGFAAAAGDAVPGRGRRGLGVEEVRGGRGVEGGGGGEGVEHFEGILVFVVGVWVGLVLGSWFGLRGGGSWGWFWFVGWSGVVRS